MRFGVLAIVLLAARVAAASEAFVVEDEEPAPDEVVEVDAVSTSVAAVPRPVAPRVPAQKDGDRLIFGCVQLRMVSDYDGHAILMLTFVPACERDPSEQETGDRGPGTGNHRRTQH